MKLLFDENLSPRRVNELADVFPHSAHVHRLGLGGETDQKVWEFAKAQGLMIVSKDPDFHERSLLFGYPPKVIRMRRGNCTVQQIGLILRNKVDAIRNLQSNPDLAYLILL